MEETQVTCRKCGARVALRISRVGFLQRKVLSYLGVYPWKCGACGSAFLFPSRGHGVRSRRAVDSDPAFTHAVAAAGSLPRASKPHA